ncbi:hypothetical protein AMTRI_Chr05g70160 [Amborella trichopoda]
MGSTNLRTFSLAWSLNETPSMLLSGISTLLLLLGSGSTLATVLIYVSVEGRFILSISIRIGMDMLMLLPGVLRRDFWVAFPTLCSSLSLSLISFFFVFFVFFLLHLFNHQ